MTEPVTNEQPKPPEEKKPHWWHHIKAELKKDAAAAGNDLGNALGEAFANR